jgi:hypothetical protein
MIIIMKMKTGEGNINAVINRVEKLGFKAHVSTGE